MPADRPDSKLLRLPPRVHRTLATSAHVAGVPVEEVMATAFTAFSRLEPELQRRLVWDFWFRGTDEMPRRPRGYAGYLLAGSGAAALGGYLAYWLLTRFG